MDNPTIDDIRSMPKEDLAAVNHQLMKKLAIRTIGVIFLKLSVSNLTKVLVKGLEHGIK